MSKKAYICDFLDWEMIFNSKYWLNRHITSKHFKNKKFEWKQWGKKFALSHNLKEHEYVHTQELPFVCGIDGWTLSFRQRGKLSLHREKHPTYKKRVYKKNAELNFQIESIESYSPMAKYEMHPSMMNFELATPIKFPHQIKHIGYLNSLRRSDQMFHFDQRNFTQQTANENVNYEEESKEADPYHKEEPESYTQNFFRYSSF